MKALITLIVLSFSLPSMALEMCEDQRPFNEKPRKTLGYKTIKKIYGEEAKSLWDQMDVRIVNVGPQFFDGNQVIYNPQTKRLEDLTCWKYQPEDKNDEDARPANCEVYTCTKPEETNQSPNSY